MSPEIEPQDPNAQMIEPALGSDDMDQFIASLEEGFNYGPTINLGTLAPQGEDEPPVDDQPDGDEPADEPSPAEPTADDTELEDSVVVNGQQFARADIERLYNFDKYLRDNPAKAQRVAEALASDGQAPVPTSEPTASEVTFQIPTAPDDLDLDDPTTRALWTQTVEARKEAWEIRQELAKTTGAIAANQQAIGQRQAQEDTAIALTNFKTQFPNLNEDDISVIRNECGPLIGAYLQQMPPVQALTRALEVAAFANADIRPKLLDPNSPNPSHKTTSTRRKARLGSISGTPRSAPKVDSKPTYKSDRDMVNEFAQELANNGLGQ